MIFRSLLVVDSNYRRGAGGNSASTLSSGQPKLPISTFRVMSSDSFDRVRSSDDTCPNGLQMKVMSTRTSSTAPKNRKLYVVGIVGKKTALYRPGARYVGCSSNTLAWGPALTSTFKVFSKFSTGLAFEACASMGFDGSGVMTIKSTPLLSPV